jgi:diketogulonate reductase-like aldo/keto reductase
MVSSRREFIKTLMATGLGLRFPDLYGGTSDKTPITKKIPKTGVQIPVIGMGTWITFNVGDDSAARQVRVHILREFLRRGGRVIDSSPMYGSSEEVVGYALDKLQAVAKIFAATKVWTADDKEGRQQNKRSKKLWGVNQFELLQVHNLVGWETHLPRLFEMKKQGQLDHVGVTTSHGRRHKELEGLMRKFPLDFIQLTYNLRDREAEKRLLPLAMEKGIAVIANRPFQGGRLVDDLQKNNKPLPSWASAIGCRNWPQFLLKYIVSHPAISCAIPATSRVEHMQENMGAGFGDLPDAKIRTQMQKYVESI